MKPILFNTEMVRAILDGRKTVTRRAVKPQAPNGVKKIYPVRLEKGVVWRSEGSYVWEEFKPPYQTGDILYVRETWTTVPDGSYVYKASVECPDAWAGTWRPSIHMPKEAARLFLRVKDVRVERLKQISATQAMDEGFTDWNDFVKAWDTTIKPTERSTYGWAANPWVWVIEFERISKEAALEGGGE